MLSKQASKWSQQKQKKYDLGKNSLNQKGPEKKLQSCKRCLHYSLRNGYIVGEGTLNDHDIKVRCHTEAITLGLYETRLYETKLS